MSTSKRVKSTTKSSGSRAEVSLNFNTNHFSLHSSHRPELPVALPAAGSSGGVFCELLAGRGSSGDSIADPALRSIIMLQVTIFQHCQMIFLKVPFAALCLLILLGSIL